MHANKLSNTEGLSFLLATIRLPSLQDDHSPLVEPTASVAPSDMKSTDVRGDSAVITLTDLKKGNRTKSLMDILFKKRYYSHIMHMCVLFPNRLDNVGTLAMHCQRHVHLSTRKFSTTS